jgi:DNA repair protein RecO (recombination protein O)
MLVKTTGIVLHQLKYSDSSVIAHIYTQLGGRQSFIVQGARSKSGGKKANLLQPLNILEMEVYQRGSRELQKLKEIRNKIPLNRISLDPVKTAIALFMAELLYKVLKEQEPNSGLFSFLEKSIEFFDLMEQDYINFHLAFMLQLSKHLGFSPTNNYEPTNRFFDLQNGVFLSHLPVHPYALGEDISEKLHQLLSLGFQGSMILTNAQRRELLDSILLYYSLHITGVDKFHSLDVLREVFQS